MGLFDVVVLPEDFELSEFPHNPRYRTESDGRGRRWQTKDLLCGQDYYRLRPFEEDENAVGTHQLERRVPPLQKMTKDGNHPVHDEPEGELMYWNVVRPTTEVRIVDTIANAHYEYALDIVNGTLRGVDVVAAGIQRERGDSDA